MISPILFSVLFFQQTLQVPKDLEDWKEWALYGHENRLCPTPFDDPNNHICAWPSRLKIDVERDGGVFEQSWLIYQDGWASLPGDETLWPMNVSSGDGALPVISREGRPSVYLKKGRHRVQGSWKWNSPPVSLAIPPQTGLIALERNGKTITHPKRDEEGNLWFQTGPEEVGLKEDRENMRVYRKVEDTIPTRITVFMVLDISGRSRELDLGNPLQDGFKALSIKSKLPVRMEEDGSLKVQVRAGRWEVNLTGRANDVVSELSLKQRSAPWPDQEFWVFKADHNLRSVAPSGAQAVDPSQTDMPAFLHDLPCFNLIPGATLLFEEKGRGRTDFIPDQLQLQRTLWLDFDGGGWTFKDQLTGELQQSWRLSMEAPFSPGRMTLNGKDHLITLAGNPPLPGSELRAKQIEMEVEGRLETSSKKLPIVGWSTAIDDMNLKIHLPPGWTLLGGFGADKVEGDWLHSWRLWDFFWALIISLAVGKMWRPSYGVAALVALVLFHGAPQGPRFIWASLLGAVALSRALPAGRLKMLAGLWLKLSVVALILLAIPFVLGQIQFALYPQLSMNWDVSHSVGFMGDTSTRYNYREPEMEEMVMDEMVMDDNATPMQESKSQARKVVRAPPKIEQVQNSQLNFYRDSEQSKIQTGRGIPSWQGENMANIYSQYSASMNWDGPITQGEELRFLLISPWFNRLLAILRVFFLVVLASLILEVKKGPLMKLLRKGGAVALLLPFLVLPLRAQEPSEATLQTLRDRLLKPAACYPHCAEMVKARLNMTSNSLMIDLEVHAAQQVSVPLPGRPNSVLVNGSPGRGLYLSDTGVLYVLVEPGVQKIKLVEDLPNQDAIQLNFPLQPRTVSFESQIWKVTGLHEDGTAESQLAFHRTGENLLPAGGAVGGLTPLAQITRKLTLSHQWSAQTTIETQFEAPFIADVPLLPQEKVLSQDVRISNGKAAVNMPGRDRLKWSSNLETVETLVLSASENVDWHEIWELEAGERWHVSWEGTPIIKYFNNAGRWLPRWEPRPGETLTLQISRPSPAEGQVITIDRTSLKVTPGKRASTYEMSLRIRSSLGGDHGIVLPSGAVMDKLEINDRVLPTRFEDGKLMLSLQPGVNRVNAGWRNEEGMGVLFQPAEILLEHEAVNNYITLDLSGNRWLLWAGGPAMGPAVRFWSLLAALLLISLALGKTSLAPLKIHQWFLLGLGLSQLHVLGAAVVASWFLFLAWREKCDPLKMNVATFNLLQTFLFCLSLLSLLLLLVAVNYGLLGAPNMYIAGNGSSDTYLQWYQERTENALPSVWMVGVPVFVYRILVLIWALWLALAALSWVKWGWSCFSSGSIWRKSEETRFSKPARPTPPLPDPPAAKAPEKRSEET